MELSFKAFRHHHLYSETVRKCHHGQPDEEKQAETESQKSRILLEKPYILEGNDLPVFGREKADLVIPRFI